MTSFTVIHAPCILILVSRRWNPPSLDPLGRFKALVSLLPPWWCSDTCLSNSRSQISSSSDQSVVSKRIVSVHQALPLLRESPLPALPMGTSNMAISYYHLPTKHVQEGLGDLPKMDAFWNVPFSVQGSYTLIPHGLDRLWTEQKKTLHRTWVSCHFTVTFLLWILASHNSSKAWQLQGNLQF